MGISMIALQRNVILDAIENIRKGEWKVLVVDEGSWRLIQNVVKEEDILDKQITNVEQIEHRRQQNREMDAVYFLSAESHIVDCLMADLERRRYRKAYLLWTSRPHATVRARLDNSRAAQEQIQVFKVVDVGFYPRESQLVTFRDPWSFPILYHPSCNKLVKQHMEDLAQKIVSVCVSLGEYPIIRYYRPRNPTHEASVLCHHLARFIQDEIDLYAQYHQEFPPQSNRPRATLYILDRTMDLISPLVHEFTYQAMVHDLLPIKEGEKVTYRVTSNEGRSNEEHKDIEIGEKDKIWVANRHRHMKDTIEKLMGEFQQFLDANPNFKNTDDNGTTSLSAIKDMMIGLPQFQEMKEAYSLHLTMAQDCMNSFEKQKLPDLASIEQSLATGLDEDYKRPKNLADQIVRTLDAESITPPDRLRLILLYLLYRDGLIPADITKLLAHAQLPPQDQEIINNLDLLGANIHRQLRDSRVPATPIFPHGKQRSDSEETYALSRFTPVLKSLLEEHIKGTLNQETFAYTKPQLDSSDTSAQESITQSSLRSAKPTWATTRRIQSDSKQRVILFMAGGATYSEVRSCYEISNSSNRDVYLVTSHMLTPRLFLKQVADLSVDKRALRIPAEQPKPKAPAHLFEPEDRPQVQRQPSPKRQQQQPFVMPPPTNAMANMSLREQVSTLRPPNGTVIQGPNIHPRDNKKGKKLGLFGKK